METKTHQGVTLPVVGFGTWQLVGENCYRAVRFALEVGYRHIDTAVVYENEGEVGRAVEDSRIGRETLFITTKLFSDLLQPDYIPRAVEDSLKRLRTSYIDLLLIHWPNPKIPLSQTLKAMERVKEEGKVRFIGVSNFPPSLLKEALKITPILTNQVEFHPYLSQKKLLKIAQEYDLFLTAYSPLARGKVAWDPVLKKIGEKYGKTPSQVALRYLTQFPNTIVIPKAKNESHIRENLDIFDFSLTEEEISAISALPKKERLINPSFAPPWEEDD